MLKTQAMSHVTACAVNALLLMESVIALYVNHSFTPTNQCDHLSS